MEPLDEVVPPHVSAKLRVPAVKIDTSGMEGFVLLGGRALFANPSISHMTLQVRAAAAWL